MKPGFFSAFCFATLASITDFAVGIKCLGLDGAVVVTAGGGGISMFLFGLCPKGSATVLNRSIFQVFFQSLKFLPFVVHFDVVAFAVAVQQPCSLLVSTKLNYFCDPSNW